MTLLDTLPINLVRSAPNLTPAIDLLTAVLERSARMMQAVLDRYTVDQILTTVEILLLVILTDTGLDLETNTHMVAYLRDLGTMREVAYIHNTAGQERELRAAYRDFIDQVAITRSPLYHRPARSAAEISPSSTIIGAGYAVAAAAMARMAVTGEDSDILIDRYRIANN